MQTAYAPLGAIFHDKSSIEGPRCVVDNIFRQHLGRTDKYWYTDSKYVICGDQKTVAMLRDTMESMSKAENNHSYCNFQWIIPIAGLFHGKMHTLNFICGEHYGGGGGLTKLKNHAQYCNFQHTDEKAKSFYDTEKLSIQSFRARVVAGVIHEIQQLQRKRKGGSENRNGRDPAAIFESATRAEVEEAVEKVARSVRELREGTDDHFENHLSFLEHMETYLILRLGIKHEHGYIFQDVPVDRYSVFYCISCQLSISLENIPAVSTSGDGSLLVPAKGQLGRQFSCRLERLKRPEISSSSPIQFLHLVLRLFASKYLQNFCLFF